MEPQLNKYISSSTLYLKDLLSILPLSTYIPIFGPIEPIVRLSKTPIRLEISGILRSRSKQTLHAISFSPARTKHSIINDPALHLKLKLLQPFVAKHIQTGRPQVTMHNFSCSKNGSIIYESYSSNDINKALLKRIEVMIKTIEIGHHYPVLPCLYSCPYKSNCYPNDV